MLTFKAPEAVVQSLEAVVRVPWKEPPSRLGTRGGEELALRGLVLPVQAGRKPAAGSGDRPGPMAQGG